MIQTTRYTTASGSVYEIKGPLSRSPWVRRVVRSSVSVAERVSEEWREPLSIDAPGIGHPITMVWWTGRDEHSANAVQVGTELCDDEAVTRVTQTTPVVAIDVLT